MNRSESEPLHQLLRAAGAVALDRFRAPDAAQKPDGSVVTEADKAAEEILVEGLMRLYPDDAIVAEEGTQVAGRDGTWHVDPIDGTGAFVGQLAYWGPTICRVDREGHLDVGAFYLPRLEELWFAQRGGGAFRDGVRLDSPVQQMRSNSILMAPSRVHLGGAERWPGKIRVLGSSAAHLAHVAAGSAQAAIIPRWALWDIGCGVLLIREAGRVIWTLAGDPVEPEMCDPGLPILAGAPTALRLLTES